MGFLMHPHTFASIWDDGVFIVCAHPSDCSSEIVLAGTCSFDSL